jgi:hypothetical protein
MSELLRKQQGKGQIGQQKDRNYQRSSGDEVDMHWHLPQLLAGLDVKKRQDEENRGEEKHQ